MASIYTTDDKEQFKNKGIAQEKIDDQLNYFENGFTALHIKKPASINDGILKLNNDSLLEYVSIWEEFLKTDKEITKFVPASGAASRMFKDLFSFLESDADLPTTSFEKHFFKNIKDFAFYDVLNKSCVNFYDKLIDELLSENRYKEVVKSLLDDEGLNYGGLPKGLLLFHSYANEKRTPMEEHLVEGAMYAKDKNGHVKVHFTISPDHKEFFMQLLDKEKETLEKRLGAHFDVTFSIQKPSTDTIAVDLDNNPFRDEGAILFRPGGHGALIENLNDLQSDIVFVKNIDNVVPDRYKENDALHKRMLAGVLVDAQRKAFSYLDKLESGECTQDDIAEIKSFLEKDLCTTSDKTLDNNNELMVKYLIGKLNRPMRVCGMVRNEGEPGGGPFIVENKDGSFSPQILEGSQIDKNIAAKFGGQSSHFNPVDLVCAIKNRAGEKFDLLSYVDKDTGFISSKSKNGQPLKALELPGLWNGAMSDWSTIFVEVPINTFNPVKTVNDLLRDEHQ